jgi:hypothetical protein
VIIKPYLLNEGSIGRAQPKTYQIQ